MAKTGRQSFQFMLRLPDDLRDRVRASAERSGRSMTAEIIQVLEREYPAPWPLEARIAEMSQLLQSIRSASDLEAVDRLADEMRETLGEMATGRITGLSERQREIARDQLRKVYEIEVEI